jgi:hypothetical protein
MSIEQSMGFSAIQDQKNNGQEFVDTEDKEENNYLRCFE